MTQVTHVYDDASTAREVVSALEDAGFSASEISIVTQKADGITSTTADGVSDGAATGATIGLVAGTGAGLLASLGMIAIPGIGPLVAAGVLATTLATAAAGTVTGGLLGALIDYGVSPDHAEIYAENVRRGGTWCRSRPTASASLKPKASCRNMIRSTSALAVKITAPKAGPNTIPTLPAIRKTKSAPSATATAPSSCDFVKMGRSRPIFFDGFSSNPGKSDSAPRLPMVEFSLERLRHRSLSEGERLSFAVKAHERERVGVRG